MSTSGGESYTHLLVPESKALCPKAQTVAQFMEQMIQTGTIGPEPQLYFSKVVRVEPEVKDRRNPFTGKTQKIRTRSRKSLPLQRLATTSEIVALAEHEYNFWATSRTKPENGPVELGRSEFGGNWEPYLGPNYYLSIICHVRDSLVRVCRLGSEEPDDSPPSAMIVPVYDEDCNEDDTDGFFEHPEFSGAIRIPNAGCGKFWIEFEFGKWVWPKPADDGGIGLFNPSVVKLATEIFGTGFVEACNWM